MNTPLPEHLEGLLWFVRLIYNGITTYPGRNERNDRIHEGCLELERRGLLERVGEDDGCVFWEAIDS